MLCFIILITSFSDCNAISSRLDMLDSETANADKSNAETSDKLMNYLKDKDIASFKAMLCPKTQGLTDIDDQILSTFDFIKGKIVSYNKHPEAGYEGSGVDYGKTTFLERSWTINDVVTDENKIYSINIYSLLLMIMTKKG